MFFPRCVLPVIGQFGVCDKSHATDFRSQRKSLATTSDIFCSSHFETVIPVNWVSCLVDRSKWEQAVRINRYQATFVAFRLSGTRYDKCDRRNRYCKERLPLKNISFGCVRSTTFVNWLRSEVANSLLKLDP